MTTTRVPGLPFDLAPSAGADWHLDPATGVLSTTAHPHSDIFTDPAGTSAAQHDASTLLAPAPAGDFQFSARVSGEFTATFDAAVLFVEADEQHWGKLCLEYSPAGEAMVVSVVCRGVADDSNAFVLETSSVWLRVSRIGNTFAYHASTDGGSWSMIRYFTLGTAPEALRIGFVAQSPTGEGCAVRFEDVRFVAATLEDLRNGS